jgi:hypothetical protein
MSGRQPLPYRIMEELPVIREQFDCRSRTETETRMLQAQPQVSANVTEGHASTVLEVECLLS